MSSGHNIASVMYKSNINSSVSPHYTKGVSIGCGLTALIVILSLTLHFLLERENKRRDREHGPVGSDTTVDVTEEGDKNKNFRYFT